MGSNDFEFDLSVLNMAGTKLTNQNYYNCKCFYCSQGHHITYKNQFIVILSYKLNSGDEFY